MSSSSSGSVQPGPLGCGLTSAAFCDTFDDVSSNNGRAGDLNTTYWSAGRLNPQLPTVPEAFAAGPAPSPVGCRSGVSGDIFPPHDLLICNPANAIASRHLWVSTAMQTYGVNSVRVRQPFDFKDRTGTIAFDAELATPDILYGFVSVAITEDPINATSFAHYANMEGGAMPKNAITLQFNAICTNGVMLRGIEVVKNYQQTIYLFDDSPCIAATRGQLRHVEISLSQSKIAVYANASNGSLQKQQELNIDLPFSRGYVQLNVHNHATIKYVPGDPAYPNGLLAWTARFDNVGFDGPKISGYREYEYPDSLKTFVDQRLDGSTVLMTAIGYHLGPNKDSGTFTFDNVDPTNMTRAKATFNFWANPYDITDEKGITNPRLVYRWNQGTEVSMSLTEVGYTIDSSNSLTGNGATTVSLNIPISEVIPGRNVLTIGTRGIGTGYPPAIANLDLVLTAE